jgi:hypothetical protein
MGEATGIVGLTFGDVETGHRKIVGALVGPVPQPPNVFANNAANISAAYVERIHKKKMGDPSKGKAPLTVNANYKDKAKVGRLVNNAMKGDKIHAIFSEKKVRAWAETNFDFAKMKSGKWSDARLARAIENMYHKSDPRLSMAAAIKAEPMPEGKAPRLLIADGDDGQLMALPVIKCFEDLLFHHFEDASIKHTSKKRAVQRILRRLQKKGARLVEGDGSAWDTTCGTEVRDAVENPILYHIMDVLMHCGVCPASWLEAHHKACTSKKLRISFLTEKLERIKIVIDAIRRSGHRGTSCLNWWVNFVMWACSFSSEPELYLNPDRRRTKDVTGVDRWWAGGFEGDDSLCAMYPPMKEGDELSGEFLSWWSRWGFDMKIVFVESSATFVGVDVACEKGEPLFNQRSNEIGKDGKMLMQPLFCAELPRAIVGSGISCSSGAKIAIKTGDIEGLKKLAAAKYYARSLDFAGVLPSVSRKYYRYAESLARPSRFTEDDMSLRAFGETGHSTAEVATEVEILNGPISPADEAENLRLLGYDCCQGELDRFDRYEWDFSRVTDFEGFKESLPESWRKAKKPGGNTIRAR